MKIFSVKHDPRDRNRFCGPSAISAVTGMATGEAARLLRHVTARRQITGTTSPAMRRAFAQCGIAMTSMNVKLDYRKKGNMLIAKGAETLAQWLKRMDRPEGVVYLVAAGNHWQIISGRRYVCGQTGEIVSVRDKKVHRRARVTEAYILTANDGVIIPDIAKKPTKKTTWADEWKRKRYAEFRKFAREHGLQYTIYPECGTEYISVHPTPFWPDGFETLHYDFAETLQRMEACFEDPSLVHNGYYSE